MSDYAADAWEIIAEKTAEIERLRAENTMLDGMAKLHERLKDEALQAWNVQQQEIERLRAALERIAAADPVDLALDPEWPQRIARSALANAS
jgi:hypothetical protein